MSIIKKRLLSYTEQQDEPRPSTSRDFDESELYTPRVIESLAGTIESLQMTNFMCHSNLELKFNSRINFITGRNGSGKSAIMAALIVVLGGTASLTGRGSGVSDFIKKGETWARVCITLVNEGINAYKRNVYGNRIIIVRNLSKTSANTYVIKSAAGTVVSRKKEEIDHIVLALNLQIKNPICILNQDVARSFLCATDDSVRFTMFAKATQLEHLKTIYMKTLELLIAARKQLKFKERGIEEASREIAQIKDKLTVFASLEKHVHQRTSLENEYFWSLVVDEENTLQRMNDEKSDLEEKKVELLEGETNYEQTIKEIEDELKEFQETLEKARESTSQKSDERSEAQKEAQNVEKEIDKTQMLFKHLMGKVDRQTADINGIKEHLLQNDMLTSQSHSERRAAINKIKRLEGELSDMRQNLSEIQTKHNETHESKFQLTRNLENLKSDLTDLETKKRRLETALAAAKGVSQNNLLKYGSFTPALVAAINDAAEKDYFFKKPVGPCGMHVRLTGDPKWARAVESVIGGLMASYCCDNQKDFQTLTHIMDKICHGKQPTIIISKFVRGRHNVDSKKVRVRGIQSVLDVLSFDSDIVYNTFIDQARVETILLFESDSQAAALMTHVKNVPKYVKMGVTVQSDQYFPAPNYRTYHGDSKKPLKYFERVSKSAESIMELERELKEANLRIEEKNKEIAKTRQDCMDASENLKKFESQMKELKHKESKIQVEYRHLKDIEESRPVTITRVALEEELENLQKTHEESKRKVSECKETLESLIQKKKDLIVKLNLLAMAEQGAETEIHELEYKMEERKFKLQQTAAKKHEVKNEVSKIDEKIAELEEEIEKSESSLQTKIKSAEDVCPERVKTERSPVDVQKMLEKCERYLKTAEKMAGSRQETITEYKTKMDLYSSMRKTEGVLANAIETLTRVALKKEQRLGVLQSHTASLVSFYFQATLQTRGYDGTLKVDFDNKLLEIEVKPKDATVARKDSKTLSGGERSYSTVSFILAIWKVVHMPIYFLDEFDVFMDKVNRKVIMDLLLEHANVQSNKQFVFITPQDLSNIRSSESVSVFQLPDPERKSA